VILEIHEIASASLVNRVSRISQNEIVLAPISEIILDQLKPLIKEKYEVVFSPMGINPTKFSKNVEIRNFQSVSNRNPIVIGYFGKLSPNGYSKGAEDIFHLARYHKEIDFPSQIHLVGLTANEVDVISETLQNFGVDKKKYILETHKEHDLAIAAMNLCDVLLLPKQRSNSYVGSPIKGIEYAATGLPILAAKSNANLSSYDSSVHPFWYEAGDIESMHKAIISIIGCTELDEFAQASKNFALKRSWLARTEGLLEAALKP
jgi:glycosyltransferase involved in cell wall biosynthesis